MEEHEQQSIKRSTSIWRRLSQRRRPEDRKAYAAGKLSAPIEAAPAIATTSLSPGQSLPVGTPQRKLQKRSTEQARHLKRKNTIATHLQRFDVSVPYRQPSNAFYNLQLDIPHGSNLDIPHMQSDMQYQNSSTDSQLQSSKMHSSAPNTLEVQPVDSSPPPTPRTRILSTALPHIQPFPVHSPHTHVAPWDIFLSPQQVYSLVLGHAPHQSDAEPSSSDINKWFIYSEGPDRSGKLKVHFHRSWTGMKMAELFVVIDLQGDGAGKLVGIKWDGGEGTNGMMEEEAKYMVGMTCAWVLGVRFENGEQSPVV